MTDSYSKIVNTETAGDQILASQGSAKAQGFSNVSQFWFPKTISYEDAIDKLEKERNNRRDIVSDWADWSYVNNKGKIGMKNGDGEIFTPTDYALLNSTKYCALIPSTISSVYYNKEFRPDNTDVDILCELLNHRKQLFHQVDSGDTKESRKLLFRVYSDQTLRAVLTTTYACVDNRWYLEVMRDLIPGGRVSHARGNADTIYYNILMPDNVREEEDSQYGGMVAIKNSEIGQTAIDALPSLFRAICRNGCVHSEKKGVSFRKVHRGEIDLETLAADIGECVNKQIPLLPTIMDNFLKLRSIKLDNVTSVLAQVAKDGSMSKEQARSMFKEWAMNEGQQKTALGVVNAITRMGQLYDADVCYEYDSYAGRLVGANWSNIIKSASTLSDKEVEKILGMAS